MAIWQRVVDGKRMTGWTVAVDVHGRQKRATFDTHAEAKRWQNATRTARDNDKLGVRCTFSEYIAAHWPVGKISAETEARERSNIDAVLAPTFGKSQLAKITRSVIGRWQIALGRDGYSDASVDVYTRLLHKILADAAGDPDVKLEMPIFPDRDKPVHVGKDGELHLGFLRLELDEDEQEALFAAFDDRAGFMASLKPNVTRIGGRGGIARKADSKASLADFERFKASKRLFLLAVETGLDLGDLLDLRWKAVDLKAGTIAGRRKKDKEVYLIDIEGSKALAGMKPGHPNAFVLTTTAGKPYSTATVARYWKRAKKISGITRRLRFKDLRHSHACDLINAGVPMAFVASTLGHADGSRTTARYAKVDPKVALAAIRAAKAAK